MSDQFSPGTYGCHEALHMVGALARMVDVELCEHTAIIANVKWHKKALRVCNLLNELYREIGAKHL